ncbi:hypothetical protein SAMN05428974_1089 [Sphingopyxis sp. YR583]|uniref:surface-adhesin E family protein n=1 Tax=Sphingopyxis sp. YR583 TaxID=1881047 RepID=UPI0008A7D6EB|nr:surface-adhesin E family protein [Sphingopyxis sp. YR583]SEH14101.1 hypothetical protein SAMN05428974_1089 [Sphingopyxis sp. YR583]
MRKFICAIVAVSTLGVAAPAAAEWTRLTDDDRGVFHYYDPATAKRSGPLVQYRSRADGRNATLDEDEPPLSVMLEEMDCKGNRMRPIEIIDYDASGAEIQRFDMSDEEHWFDIAPDSIAARKRETLCR